MKTNTPNKPWWIAINVIVVILIFGIAFSFFNAKPKLSISNTASLNLPRSLAQFHDSKKFVEVEYESQNDLAFLHIVRCVEKGNQLHYPIMFRKYPGYTGWLGGVEYQESFDTILVNMRANEGLASRMQIPTSQGISRVLLFVTVRKGLPGDASKEIEKWRVYEVPRPIQDKIRIPHISKLPLAENTREFRDFLGKLNVVEQEVRAKSH